MDIPAQWWTLFQSAKLNGLVEQAIKANPTWRPPKRRCARRTSLPGTTDHFWPSAQGSFDAQRFKNPVNTLSNQAPCRRQIPTTTSTPRSSA